MASSNIQINFNDFLKEVKSGYYEDGLIVELNKLLKNIDAYEVVPEVEDAAKAFAEIIIFEMETSIGNDFASGEISAEAFESINLEEYENISNIEYIGNCKYSIWVGYIGRGLERTSLRNTNPSKKRGRRKKFENLHDIFALLNDGYKDGGKESIRRGIRGVWHGKNIRALPRRDPGHFIERAKEDFSKKYGKTYNIYRILIKNEDTDDE